MPNKRYISGRQFEWKIKKDLEKRKWIVLRTGGSKGLFDLIGIKISVAGETTIKSNYYLGLGFWQLKKHISHERAKTILYQIQQALFKQQLDGVFGFYPQKNYFEQTINFMLIEDKKKIDYIQTILVYFGVIYTLPKKKKK